MARTERSETYDCMQAQSLVPAQCVSVAEGTVPYPSAPPWVLLFVDVGSRIVIICLCFVGTSSAVLVEHCSNRISKRRVLRMQP
jgi:hypothetical protein